MEKATKQFKHVIRPDGTIRVVTKASIRLEEGEIVVLDAKLHHPGRHFYDSKIRRIVPYSTAHQRDRDAAKASRNVDAREAREEKIGLVREWIASQDEKTQEALRALGSLLGLQL